MEITRAAFQDAWPQVVRALIAVTGSIDDAEEHAAEAFARAAAQPGSIDSLTAWCITVAKRSWLDELRRRAVRDREAGRFAAEAEQRQRTDAQAAPTTDAHAAPAVVDDRFALLLVACDEVLPPGSRLVLAMRLVLGIPLDRVAVHLGIDRATAAARLTRAKRTLAAARGGFQIPETPDARRLASARDVVYGLFSLAQRLALDPEDALADLAGQARTLAAALVHAAPRDPEALGLLAVVTLGLARRPGRLDADGTALAADEVDRSRWDGALLGEGLLLSQAALEHRPPGRYALESLVAALHSRPSSFWGTDWAAVAAAHGMLAAVHPSPSGRLAQLIAEGYRALKAARGTGEPAAVEEVEGRIRSLLAESAPVAPALERDARLALADLAWRTGRPEAGDLYREIERMLARTPALAAEPVRLFCARRAAGVPRGTRPG